MRPEAARLVNFLGFDWLIGISQRMNHRCGCEAIFLFGSKCTRFTSCALVGISQIVSLSLCSLPTEAGICFYS